MVAGPVEATAWGNALVQGRALGAASGALPDLRALLRQHVELTHYRPRGDVGAWDAIDARTS